MNHAPPTPPPRVATHRRDTHQLRDRASVELAEFREFRQERAGHDGPDPRHTTAPGDQGTCLQAGCHTGALNPSAGSVQTA